MFSFPLIKGDPATVLLDKNNIVLTRSFAHKVYGSEDILGKEIVINGKHRLIVTGVMEDLPYNTHFWGYRRICPFRSIGRYLGNATDIGRKR